MGAGAGWLCWERVWRAMGSGTCVGGQVGGVGAARGGTLRAAVGIVNKEVGGGTLGAAVGGTLGSAAGGTVGQQWGPPLELGMVWQPWLGACKSGGAATPRWGPM